MSEVNCDFDLWRLGNFIGIANLKISIEHSSFFKQNKAGIRTEDNIYYSEDILPFNQITSHRLGDNDSTILFKQYIKEFRQFRFNKGVSSQNEGNKISGEQKELITTFYNDLKSKIKHAPFSYMNIKFRYSGCNN